MELKEFCRQGLARVLGRPASKVFDSAGEFEFDLFKTQIWESLRQAIPEQSLHFGVAFNVLAFLPTLMTAAASLEGYHLIPCQKEKALIDELFRKHVRAFPHEFVL